MRWTQIYVKAPIDSSYHNPRFAKRIDDHITQMFPAAFVAPDGIPVKNDNGEYEVRCFVEEMAGMVEKILTGHYGLEITRKVVNGD